MTAKGHVLLALTVSTSLMTMNHINITSPQSIQLLGLIAAGSLVPDIDEPKSYIGRKFTVFAYVLKGFGIKHRTITHWLIGPLAIAVLLILLNGFNESITYLAFLFGIILHTAGDLLTRGGIVGYLWPLLPETTIRLLPKQFTFYTGGATEYLLITLMFIFSTYLVYKDFAYA